jgi:uncharacterized protein YndB with AHSA1/START domain
MANPLKLLKLKPASFQFIQETPVNAPPKKVWAALLNVEGWFRFHPTEAGGPRQKLEAHPGGRWFSEAADGTTFLMAIVTHIEPYKLLRLAGPVGLSHLPVSNAFIFELQPRYDGKTTLLRVGQRTFGLLTSDVKKNYAKGWKQQLSQLKAAAEKA